MNNAVSTITLLAAAGTAVPILAYDGDNLAAKLSLREDRGVLLAERPPFDEGQLVRPTGMIVRKDADRYHLGIAALAFSLSDPRAAVTMDNGLIMPSLALLSARVWSKCNERTDDGPPNAFGAMRHLGARAALPAIWQTAGWSAVPLYSVGYTDKSPVNITDDDPSSMEAIYTLTPNSALDARFFIPKKHCLYVAEIQGTVFFTNDSRVPEQHRTRDVAYRVEYVPGTAQSLPQDYRW